MKKFLMFALCSISLMQFSLTAMAQTTASDIKLPVPNVTGGMPIMDVFKNRQSNVKFAKKDIPIQMLSDLLWAADGVNRPDGKRTAPSALNAQVLTVYAAFGGRIYKYDPDAHTLTAFSKEDVRPIVGNYPLILMYSANLTRQSKYLASVDCGFVGQNVYLYSAANGLNTIFLYNVNSIALNNNLEFKMGEEILFAQAVGFAPGK